MSYSDDEKFNIVGDLAYTVDDILIYNIFVRNLPESCDIFDISKFFRKFGEVLQIGFRGKGKSKNCFVNFADPKIAAIVLQRKSLFFMTRVISVQPCKSWYQPYGQNLIKLLNGNSNNVEQTTEAAGCSNFSFEQNALILTLNDDCLEYVCKMLPLKDQIQFALTCQRFLDVYKMYSPHKYVTLNTDIFATLTQFQTKIFLEIVGAQIKTLVIHCMFSSFKSPADLCNIIQFLGDCVNVETIIIEDIRLQVSKICILIEKMSKLKELHLINVKIEADFKQTLERMGDVVMNNDIYYDRDDDIDDNFDDLDVDIDYNRYGIDDNYDVDDPDPYGIDDNYDVDDPDPYGINDNYDVDDPDPYGINDNYDIDDPDPYGINDNHNY